LESPLDGVFVALGDQPLVSPTVIAALAAAGRDQPIVLPRYAGGGGFNPVLLLRDAWPLVDAMSGDQGMRPLILAHPDLVREVPVPGANPDVDTLEDLDKLAELGTSSVAQPSNG
jgi:CTP:molybdopterin cytidylyltransferase MocA